MRLLERLKARVDDDDCQEAAALIEELEGELSAADDWIEQLKSEIAEIKSAS